MNRSIIRSIKPYYYYLICEGIKKEELCKTYPKVLDWDGVVYLYCTKDVKSFERIPHDCKEKYRKHLGKVGACFTSYCIEPIFYKPYDKKNYSLEEAVSLFLHIYDMCIHYEDLENYGNGKKLYGMHISDLLEFQPPKDLKSFYKLCKHYVPGYLNGCDDICGCYENDECKNGYIPITSAPQSWMYCKDGKDL